MSDSYEDKSETKEYAANTPPGNFLRGYFHM